MKFVIGEIRENMVLCEAEESSFVLDRDLFPESVCSGDVGNYEDGIVSMWDEARQVEEEQLEMLFKMMC